MVSTCTSLQPAQISCLSIIMLSWKLFSLFQLQLLLIVGSIEGYSMKLMPELESLRCIYPTKCLCALLYAAYPDLGCASSNFKFRAIAKNAGTFRRDLGAKFSIINDPKK